MIDNPLDDFVKAYQGDIQYDFDNEILLNWYPKRILAHTSTTNSVLELGLGHGYTTNIFSAHYQEHTVLDGSKAVIENFKKKTINFRELCFITYAGLIKGSIAFALVLKIPYEGTPDCHDTVCISKVNYELLLTTTLSIVMATTLIFGTFIKKISILCLCLSCTRASLDTAPSRVTA